MKSEDSTALGGRANVLDSQARIQKSQPNKKIQSAKDKHIVHLLHERHFLKNYSTMNLERMTQ